MKISIRNMEPRDSLGKVFVNVTFWDENGPCHDSAEVEVFVEQTDSLSEIRKQALEQAQEFFRKALAAEPVETEIVDWTAN